ncbi:MAG TPA: type IV pili twitching motility protein PilT, partial [Prochlorococcaceae cyanobacterium Fu_MAG_72]|nr:type IV pili twitching motility protein PilT [Prochlorococcaceae cyanobacterium Fu_MAG_72]
MNQPVFPPNFPPRAPTSSPQAAAAIPTPSAEVSTPLGVKPPGIDPSLEEIVRIAYQQGYSDVHLGIGEAPRFRSLGEMQKTDWPVTDLEV